MTRFRGSWRLGRGRGEGEGGWTYRQGEGWEGVWCVVIKF